MTDLDRSHWTPEQLLALELVTHTRWGHRLQPNHWHSLPSAGPIDARRHEATGIAWDLLCALDTSRPGRQRIVYECVPLLGDPPTAGRLLSLLTYPWRIGSPSGDPHGDGRQDWRIVVAGMRPSQASGATLGEAAARALLALWSRDA